MRSSVNDQTFKQEVLESPVPVLVNFWAPWCGLCRMIDPVLGRFQSEWGGQISVVGVNADENLRLSSTYRLTTLPTLLLLEQGRVIQRIEGFRSKEDLRLALEKISSRYVCLTQ